jgi:lipoprotein NlpI
MPPHFAIRLIAVLLLLLLPAANRDETAADHRRQARSAWEQGEKDKALQLADKAVAADAKDVQSYLFRGALRAGLGQRDKAIDDFTKCIELDPKCVEAYDARGSEHFKLGHIRESLADWDRQIELRPKDFPGHWRRGISLYYAGRFDEGRQQFKGYERVDTNDVENAVWHFLCGARLDGVEKARMAMLKIGKDRRVPMMQVYDLYRGVLKPADVLAAAEADGPTAEQRSQRLFYAHLYLGLYYDILGDRKKALEHMSLAAGKYRIGQYMGDVAHVHHELLKKEQR